MKALAEVSDIADAYADKGVDYVLIYITEAHPTDGWNPQWAPEQFQGSVAHARSTTERLQSARKFVDSLGLTAPVLVDTIADELENRYEARPERLYVVQEGKVLWRCGLGPFEYDAPGLAAFLESHVGPAS